MVFYFIIGYAYLTTSLLLGLPYIANLQMVARHVAMLIKRPPHSVMSCKRHGIRILHLVEVRYAIYKLNVRIYSLICC